MLKLWQQGSVKQQFTSLGMLTVYGIYIMETILTIRQADCIQPKVGSLLVITLLAIVQLVSPNINLNFVRKSLLFAGIKLYYI